MTGLGTAPRASEVPASAAPAILIVEDDVLLRVTMADELREQAYTVVEAATGDEALLILTSGTKIDLVLTDVTMPGKTDGLALAKYLRNHCPMIKVVILSGEGLLSRHDTSLGDAFFAKPCNIPSLFDEIGKLIRPQVS
jgi:CheY-like chemotaxis protein